MDTPAEPDCRAEGSHPGPLGDEINPGRHLVRGSQASGAGPLPAGPARTQGRVTQKSALPLPHLLPHNSLLALLMGLEAGDPVHPPPPRLLPCFVAKPSAGWGPRCWGAGWRRCLGANLRTLAFV